MSVFALDKNHNPLMPCSERKARKLLEKGRAKIHRTIPFVIRLKDVSVDQMSLPPLQLKIDPGSKETGLAVLQGSRLIWAGIIKHKSGITAALDSRRSLRRGRRSRHLRYRPARFDNRKRPEGWLPPSLEAWAAQVIHAVHKLRSWMPITSIALELVKFDTQLIENPEISGTQYQQGELWGYEIRQYLLYKFGHKCAYCQANNVALEIEHIIPKSRGGSSRVSNLTIACHDCNQKKGSKTAEEFGYPNIQKMAKSPLKDAAKVNSTRWRLYNLLKEEDLPIETGTGGLTKFNRTKLQLPKTHYFDAASVGKSCPTFLEICTSKVNIWEAKGRGKRQICQTDKFGFPKQYRSREKGKCGFQTGDLIKLTPKRGKFAGKTWTGRAVVRADGSLYIPMGKERITGTYKTAQLIQRGDGWNYSVEEIAMASC